MFQHWMEVTHYKKIKLSLQHLSKFYTILSKVNVASKAFLRRACDPDAVVCYL